MKKILIFIIVGVLMNTSLYSQAGAFCEGAILFSNANSCYNNQELTGTETEVWYSFVAEAADEGIELKNLDSLPGHVHRMEFYSGTCAGNNLILVDSVEATLSNDTLLVLSETNLTIGNTYYIKLIRGVDGCGKCTLNGANYNLCIAVANNLNTTVFCLKACGLNYATANVALNQRISSYAGTGSVQPATMTVSGIPSSVQVVGAYLWFSIVGQTTPITTYPALTLFSPTGVSIPITSIVTTGTLSNSATGWLGVGGTTFASGNTIGYRATVGVTGYSGLQLNGNYTINGLPTILTTDPDEDVTGATLMIIYKDNCSSSAGSLWIGDGIQTGSICVSGAPHTPVACFPFPPTGSPITQFLLCADVEDPALSGGCKIPSTLPHVLFAGAFNADMWNLAYNNYSFNGDFSYCTSGDPNSVALVRGFYFTDNSLTCPITNISVSGSTTICEGQSTLLNANAVGASGYVWLPTSGLSNPNISNPIASPTVTTTYTVTAENSSSCSYTATVTVNVINVSVDADADITICSGQGTTLTASGIGTFIWSNGQVGSTINVSPTSTTSYTVTASNGGCTDTDVVVVTVNPSPAFTISGSFTSCVQAGGVPTPYTVPHIPGITYTWSTSTGLSGAGNIVNLDFYPNGGTVTFVATDIVTGCTYTQSMYVGSCCAPSGNPIINFTNLSTTDIPTAYPGIGSPSGGAFTIVGSTFSINGTFTVNSNLTLKGCTVLMGYNAKIIVDPGKTLTITSASISAKSHLYACNEMWDGIYVSSPTSLVVINNGSTVEDALNAVVSENKGNYKIFSLTAYGNVIFNKNYKSIVVKNDLVGTHPGLIRSTTIRCYDGVVDGNPVNTSNKLHFPHATERSFMGMEIINVNDITIGVPSLPLLNTFDNMDFGIKSTNSSLNVFNNDFKNITSVGAVPKGVECTVGTAICATGGKTVIRTINVGSTSPIPFYKNTFTNDNKGVVATQFMNANIWKNNFNNITNTGIRLSKNPANVIVVNQNVINNARVGIDCFDNQSANVTIDNNDIDAGTLLVASGVLAQEIIGGTTVYKITRNTIKNVRYGAYGIGLKNSDISRNDVNLKHTTSPIQECYGIRLANSSLCTVVSNRVYGTNIVDYWVQGISLDLCMSDYVTCNESHNLGTGMFFGGVQTPNTYVAKNLMNNNFRGLVINSGIIGQQGVFGTPHDNRWTGIFTSGCYTETVSSFGFLSQFFVRPGLPYEVASINNCSAGFPILFNPTSGFNPIVCASIFPGSGSPAPKPLLLQIAGDSIVPVAYDLSTRWMLKQSLYQHLKVDPSTISTEPLIAQFQSDYSVNNMGKLDDVETVLSDLNTASASSLSSIQSLNNAVVPASDVETNSKWMNNLLIENALTGGDYSASQISDLQVLAAKCPYNDGQAVYQARVILSQIEDVEYLNTCETAIPVSHTMSPFAQSEDPSVYNDFKLFPNPNDGTMNFIYSLKETSQGEMVIFDITGKTVAKYSLAAGLDKQIFINETSLSNGVYFYKVIIDSEIKLSDKIVIIK